MSAQTSGLILATPGDAPIRRLRASRRGRPRLDLDDLATAWPIDPTADPAIREHNEVDRTRSSSDIILLGMPQALAFK